MRSQSQVLLRVILENRTKGILRDSYSYLHAELVTLKAFIQLPSLFLRSWADEKATDSLGIKPP